MGRPSVQRKGSLAALGEFGLIDQLKKMLPQTPGVKMAIGDDTAVVAQPGGQDLLLTTDMLLEGAHFTRALAPQSIGRKALACSLSDIAAMGGRPQYALVSLGLPSTVTVDFVKALYRGMGPLARATGVTVVGGDTVRSAQLTLNVALTGVVARTRVCLRSGARPGDWIWVSGPLGGSLASGHHWAFTPRLAQGQWLARYYRPTAMMDISDGLAQDLGHILKASGVGARLEAARIPCRPGANLDAALFDGEDFELLFTLPEARARRLQRSRARHTFYPMGVITSGRKVIRMKEEGQAPRIVSPRGYTHF